jgi:hypothetical protein
MGNFLCIEIESQRDNFLNFSSYGRRMDSFRLQNTPLSPQSVYTGTSTALKWFLNFIIIICAIVILYFFYNYVVTPSNANDKVVAFSSKMAANALHKNSSIASLYEGGEYTVNLWVYIAGYTTNLGVRKHVLEIGGSNFATLLIALGAYKNSLLVRVHTKDASGSLGSGITDCSGNDCSDNSVSSSSNDYSDPSIANREDTSLTTNDMDVLFTPLLMDNGLLDVKPMCDIDTIDMQRWVQITVVMNGRTCDVYMDGKLSRSCVLKHYYKVDPTGASIRVADRSGFDGYVSNVTTFKNAINPDQIYQLYLAGPQGNSTDILSYIKSFF